MQMEAMSVPPSLCLQSTVDIILLCVRYQVPSFTVYASTRNTHTHTPVHLLSMHTMNQTMLLLDKNVFSDTFLTLSEEFYTQGVGMFK